MPTRYEERTKEELLELAREREIEGRSGMTKDELIAALRGEVIEAAPEEKVRPEEVPPETPLVRAERYRAKYELTGALGDYNNWKAAETEHLG
jgi:hypothetical protein